MYFNTYDAALSAAIKQSKGQLGDTKLYVKEAGAITIDPISHINTVQYKIGFTPDNPNDAYIYNGLVYSSVTDGEGTVFKCKTEKENQ